MEVGRGGRWGEDFKNGRGRAWEAACGLAQLHHRCIAPFPDSGIKTRTVPENLPATTARAWASLHCIIAARADWAVSRVGFRCAAEPRAAACGLGPPRKKYDYTRAVTDSHCSSTGLAPSFFHSYKTRWAGGGPRKA